MVHSILIVIVTALTTILTRALPFVVFGGKKKVPAVVQYLGKVLPCAIMAILVVYCFKNVTPLSGSHGLPEFMAAALVAGLHLWKRNTLLSILYASRSGDFCVKIMYKSKFFVLSYIFLSL